MSNLVAGPKLDARIAEGFMGWSRKYTADGWGWKGYAYWADARGKERGRPETFIPSRGDSSTGQVLDRLVEQGYEPALVYDKLTKQWTLCLHAQESSDICHGLKRDLGGDPARWQPTRPLAVAAAVVALMDEEHRQPCGE